MHVNRIKIAHWLMMAAFFFVSVQIQAQEVQDTSAVQEPQEEERAINEFSISAKLNTRGEIRYGGFNADDNDNQAMAHFLKGQYQFSLNYKRADWLELKLTPQMAGVWGQKSGLLSLAEAWALLKTKHTLFAKIGRQTLEYDDERILGYDDWSMTAPTHDALKLGFEGYGHKIHIILAYNQDPENVDAGGTYYSGGIQPYKTMQTFWYHYDTPKSFFGFSLLAMNIGMQNDNPKKPKTFYQQIFGTYMELRPKYTTLSGAFYYQMGKEEHGIPVRAFMGSVKLKVRPHDMVSVQAGYDYLSGDKYFAVPPIGMLGVTRRDTVRGFSSLFGSHHDFYGAMDFFYMDSYVSGFTPGLQNAYAGISVYPVAGLSINAAYHFFAIATDLDKLKKPLGHEVETSLSYTFAKFVTISAGYTFMKGTETMLALQRISNQRRLHWGWVMLTINPTIFTTTWKDKKKRVKS